MKSDKLLVLLLALAIPFQAVDASSTKRNVMGFLDKIQKKERMAAIRMIKGKIVTSGGSGIQKRITPTQFVQRAMQCYPEQTIQLASSDDGSVRVIWACDSVLLPNGEFGAHKIDSEIVDVGSGVTIYNVFEVTSERAMPVHVVIPTHRDPASIPEAH